MNLIFVVIVLSVVLCLVGVAILVAAWPLQATRDTMLQAVETLRKLPIALESLESSFTSSHPSDSQLLERVESLERRHERLDSDFQSRAAQLSTRITRLGRETAIPVPPDEEDDDAAIGRASLTGEPTQLEMDLPRRRRARRGRRR